MKKFICAAVAAVCVASAFNFGGCAVGEAYVEYTLSEDGTYYIVSGVSGDKRGLTEYTVPATYTEEEDGEAKPVKEIGEMAFAKCYNLASVALPDTVTKIGDSSFIYCALTSVEIPESVSYIGYGAFGACTSLTQVTIPESVTTLSTRAFAYCSKLKTVYVKAQLTVLESRVFYNSWYSNAGEIYTDTSLEKVYLPATLRKIHIDALEGNIISDIYFAGTKDEWDAVYFYETVKKEGTEDVYEEKRYYDKSKYIPSQTEIHFNVQF